MLDSYKENKAATITFIKDLFSIVLIMDDINFCPFCDASNHKVTAVKGSLLFCKECNHFFQIENKKLKCLKCNSTNLVDSDFPGPDGSLVFQCRDCKKMFSTKELLSHNKLNSKLL